MACSKPFIRKIDKKSNIYNRNLYLPLPCGHCFACIRDKINMWSDRLLFETMTQERASTFITLTLNDEHLTLNDKGLAVVNPDDIKGFCKRLRKYLGRSYKYFFTSEYGEDLRPHYHGILCGVDFQDYFDFKAIEKAWSLKKQEFGFFSCDNVNPSTIRYTIKYLEKEFTPRFHDEYFKLGLDLPFHRMSKGIGRDYFFRSFGRIEKIWRLLCSWFFETFA